MRVLVAASILIMAGLALAACSRAPTPPVGRWQGHYEASDTIVAARVEIGKDGLVRVSAPDSTDIDTDSTEAQRQTLRDNLAMSLSTDWYQVAPRQMDFDGETFRKPGGIAPQMIWNPKTKGMTLVLFLGKRAGIKVPLRKVKDFTDDPFAD